MLRVLLVGSLVCLLSACGGAVSGAALLKAARARSPEVTQASLEHGESVFDAKCHRCHKLPDPKSKSAEEWPALVDEMGKKAHLDARSRKDVLDYVLAVHDATP